jgi:hypothetical protein
MAYQNALHIKISFCLQGINSFNKKLDFLFTKNPIQTKEERVLTSTTASVFSFGQEYQFLLEKCSYL